MIAKIKEFLTDDENKGFVADIAKSLGWGAIIFNFEQLSLRAKQKIELMYQNKTLLSYYRGLMGFLGGTGKQLAAAVALEVVGWLAVIGALLAIGPGATTVPVLVTVAVLLIALAAGGLVVLQAVKAHAAAEIAIAGFDALSGIIDGVKSTLPSFFHFDWKSTAARAKAADGLRVIYLTLYKALFWLGTVNIALTVVVCVQFRVYHGAILAASILNFALAGLGMKVGYKLATDGARVWSFRFILATVSLGMILLTVGPTVSGWWNSHAAASQANELRQGCIQEYYLQGAPASAERQRACKEAVGGTIMATLEGFAELSAKKDGLAPEEEKQRSFYEANIKAALEGKPVRAAMPKDPPPTCADGKDNNGNSLIDEDDPSCNKPDPTGWVKDPSTKKVTLRPGCHISFPTVNNGAMLKVPYCYDARLAERDMPKPPAAAGAPKGNGGASTETKTTVTAAAPPPGSTPASRAGAIIADRYADFMKE